MPTDERPRPGVDARRRRKSKHDNSFGAALASPKTVSLGGDAVKSGVHVHRMGAQSLGTVTTTTRTVVATIKRSAVSMDGGRVLSRMSMRLAGRHARVRADHREHVVPPWYRRWIWFRGQPPGPGGRAISEGA